MTLTELDAAFVAMTAEPRTWRHVATLDEAQGVWFQCPKCAQGKARADDGKGVKGAHYVLCWFTQPRRLPPVPATMTPGPGRWRVSPGSTGLHDLTFVGPGAYSVRLTGGCGWHGYITNGEATVL